MARPSKIPPDPNTLGGRIAIARDRLGLSQDELAKRVGAKSGGNQVSRWEHNKVEPMRVFHARIAEVLGTTWETLETGEVGPSKPYSEQSPEARVSGPVKPLGVSTPDALEAMGLELIRIAAQLRAAREIAAGVPAGEPLRGEPPPA